MINVTSFYSKCGTKFTKYYALNEAVDHASSNKTTEIVALPPNAGNIEDFPNDLNENTVNLSSIFEPACEVEVFDVKEDDFTSALSVEVARPKRRKKLPLLIKTLLQSHWAIFLTHINIFLYIHLMTYGDYLFLKTFYQRLSNKLTTTQIETKMTQALQLNQRFFDF